MKKLFLLFTLLLFTFNSYSQDSKFYLGLGAGLATIGGDVNDGDAYKMGLHINFLNTGYRFNETWGLTVNLGSAGHPIDGSDSAFGIGAFSAGPMISFPTGNLTWDLKPQYAFSMAGVWRGDEIKELGFEDVTMRGSGFIIGNSLVMKAEKGFTWSVDFDLLFGGFDEIETMGITISQDKESYTSLRLGAGIRYNF